MNIFFKANRKSTLLRCLKQYTLASRQQFGAKYSLCTYNYQNNSLKLRNIKNQCINQSKQILTQIYCKSYTEFSSEQHNSPAQFKIALASYDQNQPVEIDSANGEMELYLIMKSQYNSITNADEKQLLSSAMQFYFGDKKQPKNYTKAFEESLKASKLGNSLANVILGLAYFTGNGVEEKNNEKALEYFFQAASKNNLLGVNFFIQLAQQMKNEEIVKKLATTLDKKFIQSLSNFGQMYYLGQNLKKNKQKAFEFYKMSADLGNAESQNILGKMYIEKESYRNLCKAIEYFKKASDQNVGDASFNLAIMYDQGLGTKRDIARVIHYYKKAIEQKISKAAFNLSLIYLIGDGVKQDEQEFIKYLEIAANLDFPQALFELGMLYKKGKIVVQNNEKALQLLKKVADKHEMAEAQLVLGLAYLRGDMKSVQSSIEEGKKYLQRAVDQNLAQAQLHQGKMYADGEFYEKDLLKAEELLKKASDDGLAQAHFELGIFYMLGYSGSEPNYKKAIEYFERAGKENMMEANFNLALMYHNALGVPKDMQKAIEYYKLASKQGMAEASSNLGLIYLQGDEVNMDLNQALKHFQNASKYNEPMALRQIGKFYMEGKAGLKKNLDEGIKYLSKAAKLKNASACYELAQYYFFGTIIQKNFEKAEFYCEKAIEGNIQEAIPLLEQIKRGKV